MKGRRAALSEEETLRTSEGLAVCYCLIWQWLPSHSLCDKSMNNTFCFMVLNYSKLQGLKRKRKIMSKSKPTSSWVRLLLRATVTSWQEGKVLNEINCFGGGSIHTREYHIQGHTMLHCRHIHVNNMKAKVENLKDLAKVKEQIIDGV